MATKLIPPPDIKPEETEEEGAVMGFFDHLEELRTRLFRVVLAIALGMLISVPLTNPVLNIMKDTYGERFLITDPTDSVVVFFRVCLMLGAIFASPMITYQLLMFILPGLTRKEKRGVLLSLPGTTTLFLVGIAFTWLVLLPTYVNFLKGFQEDVFRPDWRADSYVGFVTSILFWHGVAFEAPIVFFVLGRLGFISARTMISYWRYAIVGAAVLSAIITPTVDPVTMAIIMVVLLGLYVLSIALVGLTSGFAKQPAR
jgi:sec-independent protein translocase protein TatC